MISCYDIFSMLLIMGFGHDHNNISDDIILRWWWLRINVTNSHHFYLIYNLKIMIFYDDDEDFDDDSSWKLLMMILTYDLIRFLDDIILWRWWFNNKVTNFSSSICKIWNFKMMIQNDRFTMLLIELIITMLGRRRCNQ